jgi:hypothetical protein
MEQHAEKAASITEADCFRRAAGFSGMLDAKSVDNAGTRAKGDGVDDDGAMAVKPPMGDEDDDEIDDDVAMTFPQRVRPHRFSFSHGRGT